LFVEAFGDNPMVEHGPAQHWNMKLNGLALWAWETSGLLGPDENCLRKLLFQPVEISYYFLKIGVI